MTTFNSTRLPVIAAYGVKDYQVAGGPAWASEVEGLFDIEARAAGEPSKAEARAMLQSLLAERFHFETAPRIETASGV